MYSFSKIMGEETACKPRLRGCNPSRMATPTYRHVQITQRSAAAAGSSSKRTRPLPESGLMPIVGPVSAARRVIAGVVAGRTRWSGSEQRGTQTRRHAEQVRLPLPRCWRATTGTALARCRVKVCQLPHRRQAGRGEGDVSSSMRRSKCYGVGYNTVLCSTCCTARDRRIVLFLHGP